MYFYKEILNENVGGIAKFIERLVSHEGKVQIEKLHVVDISDTKPFVRMGVENDKKNDYALGTDLL